MKEEQNYLTRKRKRHKAAVLEEEIAKQERRSYRKPWREDVKGAGRTKELGYDKEGDSLSEPRIDISGDFGNDVPLSRRERYLAGV